jgi:hypothetical protein
LVAIHEEGEGIFRIETDLHKNPGISEFQAHQIAEAALLGVAGLNVADR